MLKALGKLLSRRSFSSSLSTAISLARLTSTVHNNRKISLVYQGSLYSSGGYYFMNINSQWTYLKRNFFGTGNWIICQSPVGASLLCFIYNGSNGNWYMQTVRGTFPFN